MHKSAVHEGNKQFECTTCDSSFVDKNKLKPHILSVLEVTKWKFESKCGFSSWKKPFQCNTCGASFMKNYNLKMHKASAREGKKPFECSICNSSE